MEDTSERYAAIDIGANSIRLLIARPAGRQLQVDLRALRMCRLGAGMTRGEGLQPQAVARSLQALKEFCGLLQSYGVLGVRAVATSAVREAPNRALFIDRVREETGLQVEVICGEEEAYLSYLGACSALPGVRKAVVVDIGGGSTEFTFPGRQGRAGALASHSIPIGAVRLTEHPLLLPEILAGLKPVLDEIRSVTPRSLIGVGGTITTMAAIDQELQVYDPERVQGYRLPRAAVERILFYLAAKNNTERKQVAGLQPERSDIIVAGATILWAILGYLQAASITASEADILDGIILTALKK